MKTGFARIDRIHAKGNALIKPELTVATIVEHGDRFLVVEETVRGQTCFNQPAGHVEPGETIIEAAVRETREETAWDVTPEALLGLYYWPTTPRGDCILRCAFSAQADAFHADQPLDVGILTTHWLTRNELQGRQAQLRSSLVLAAIDSWYEGVRLPLSTIHHLTNE